MVGKRSGRFRLLEIFSSMKIHLQQIPHEGLHIEGKEETDILQIDDPTIRPVAPVAYQLDVGISEDGLFASGKISVELELECVNCLRKFVYPIVVEDFATQVELTGPELIDLTAEVREDILLALPAHPKCNWDGTVCPGPREKNKNNQVETDPAPSAWDTLDQLNLKQRNS
jgi:uncharacterized metal-binding protein YceD (DUF177 family)